jgi:hypothetical protein
MISSYLYRSNWPSLFFKLDYVQLSVWHKFENTGSHLRAASTHFEQDIYN